MQTINLPQNAGAASFAIKLIECLFAGFALFSTFGIVMEVTRFNSPLRSVYPVTNLLNAVCIIAGVLFSVIFPVYWQQKEKKDQINSEWYHALFRGILRYWIAFHVLRYGFAKLLQTQFPLVYSRNDAVVNQLSGFDLTWNYFGHSYTLAVIIGLLQIIGSVLLLFRRTTLLGTVILLPVLLNIALIDWFFNIEWGALMNAVSFSIGLLYLLFLRWHELKAVFLRTISNRPAILPNGLKYIVRFALIAVSFAIIFYYSTFNSHTALAGKWQVTQMIRNGDTLTNTAWLTDSTAWKNVYIETYGRLALCSNPYNYEAKRSQWVRYEYDSARHDIQLMWPQKDKEDTLDMQVSFINDKNNMEWISTNKKENLMLELVKASK